MLLPQVARAFINPYKVLQVSEDADPSQIKRAYRKLALRLVCLPRNCLCPSLSAMQQYTSVDHIMVPAGIILISTRSHLLSRTSSGFRRLTRY